MDKFLSAKQVRAITSISERQQARLVERGQFPKPFPLYEGGRRVGYRESEISEWMAAQLAAARGAQLAAARGDGAKREHSAPSSDRGGKNRHETQPDDPPTRRRPQRQAQPPPRRPQRAAPKTSI